MDLVERGVVTGVAKQLNRTKTVGTFALGTQRLYDFLDENTAFELWPVRYVNDPRVIAQERDFVSINATIAVDLLGQCASETVGGTYYSSSGGQADFARGAMYSPRRAGLRRAPLDHQGRRDLQDRRRSSRPGDVVTTLKNTVDKVVTEWGVAELRGRSIRERAAALIAIAHPRTATCSPRMRDGSATSDRTRASGGPGPMALPPAAPNGASSECGILPARTAAADAGRMPRAARRVHRRADLPSCTRDTRWCSRSTSSSRGLDGAPVIAIRTRPGNVIDHTGELVAFEVDGVDAARDGGWSVLVHGRLSRVLPQTRFDSHPLVGVGP